MPLFHFHVQALLTAVMIFFAQPSGVHVATEPGDLGGKPPTSTTTSSTTTLPSDVTIVADRDNTLYDHGSGLLSNGFGDHFFTGRSGAGGSNRILRGVVHFDLSGAVPSGLTVTSAVMRLVRVHGNTTVTISVGAHRLLSDWGEGTSHALLNEGKGAASASGDATWLHTFFSTGLWSTVGGDFVAGASATRTVLLNGVYTWSSGGMVNDVLGWLDDPGSNYGWLLSGGATTLSAKGFATRENGTIANRPRLILGLGTTTTTSTTSTTSTSSSTTTTTSTSSTTLSPPEIVGINTNVRLWVIYAPTGTIVPRYSTNLATIPIEWLSIPSFTNIPGSGTNIFQFDPPDTNAQAVFYHILQTL